MCTFYSCYPMLWRYVSRNYDGVWSLLFTMYICYTWFIYHSCKSSFMVSMVPENIIIHKIPCCIVLEVQSHFWLLMKGHAAARTPSDAVLQCHSGGTMLAPVFDVFHSVLMSDVNHPRNQKAFHLKITSFWKFKPPSQYRNYAFNSGEKLVVVSHWR